MSMTAQQIAAEIQEWFLNNDEFMNAVNTKVRTYMEAYGIDVDQPMTELQEELFCQYQVSEYKSIFGKVIASM